MPRPRKWMSAAVNPAHRGDLTRLVRRRYGPSGFMHSPETGRLDIRPTVIDELREDSDPHVRAMADFAHNTPAAKRLREAVARPLA